MGSHGGSFTQLSPEERRRLLEQRLRSKAGSRNTFPLSFAQERLWLLEQLHTGTVAYNLTIPLRLKGSLNRLALERSLNELVKRHAAFRTHFAQVDDQPVQVVSPEGEARLTLLAVPGDDPEQRESRVREILWQEAQRPFDLGTGPLYRFTLLRLADDEHILVIAKHHSVTDAWSLAIFAQELSALYAAFAEGKSSPLPWPTLQYGDFATWQRQWLKGSVFEAQLAYWKERLAGSAPLLELPADRTRPSVQSFRGAIRQVALPQELRQSLHDLCRREGVTLFMTALAAFQVLLSRYSGQHDIVVGSSIANRNRAEVEGIVGFFVNNLVLRTDLSGDPTFRELLTRVREVALGAYAHQDMPFEKLVEHLRPQRDTSYAPIYQVEFTLQNALAPHLQLPGLTVERIHFDPGTAKLDLTLSLEEGPDGIHGTLEYSTDLFEAKTIDRMWGHYQRLLEGAVADPDLPISRIPMLMPAEREEILVEWNRTEAEYPDQVCLHHLFEEQVRRSPGNVAAVFGDQQISYVELDQAANRLAHHLRALGVGPDVVVGVCVDRSIDLVVALLAVLKAGGAFLPLETDAPAPRLRQMLEDAQAPVCLTQEHLLPRLPGDVASLVAVDGTGEPFAAYPTHAPQVEGLTPDHLVSIYYTSGSTGKPKGVANIHRGWVNRMNWMQRRYQLLPHEAVLQKTTLTFDDSAVEFFWPLMVGAHIALMEPGLHKDPRAILDAAIRHQVAVIHFVPSMLSLVVDTITPADRARLGCLRHVISSGEALLPELVRRFTERVGCSLHNQWGATEVSIDSSFYTCLPEDGSENGIVPVGRPLENNEIYVLDAHLEPVPVGVAGDLYLAGIGLARGYLNDPVRTEEAFVPNPHRPGERMYRTGDRGLYRADGNILFLGRKDDQIKIRGQRVELGEIESVLATHPAVRQCAVVAHKRPDGYYLVAYCVLRPAQADDPSLGSAERLRDFLGDLLPQYMVPSRFVTMESLPTTVSGKVDRKLLPDPGDERPDLEESYAPPTTLTQLRLVEIWQEVLRLSRVGIRDDFFALGGHSLLATQVITRVRKHLQAEVSLIQFFAAPTIEALAHLVDRGREGAQASEEPFLTAPVGAEHPLSFAQQRLWFLDQMLPASGTYNVPILLRLRGHLETAALNQAITEILARHDSLRTIFRAVDGRPVQVITEPYPFVLPVTDLTHLPEEEREAEALRMAREEARRPFDLESGPLFRARLMRTDETGHLLFINVHHIVFDGWSVGVLTSDLSALYAGFLSRRESPLPPPAFQYADFADWQQRRLGGGGLEAQLSYWTEQLGGGPLPVLDLPTDRPRPPVQTYAGATRTIRLPKELADGLKALGHREGASLFMVLLALFKVLLYRYTNQGDILVGTPVANRTRVETEGLIGFFVNTLVLRSRVAGETSFRDLLMQVRRVALEAYAHQDVPFEQLVEALHPARSLDRSPLFQVMFILQNARMEMPVLPGLEVTSVELDNSAAKFDLTLGAMEDRDELAVTMEYNTDLFDPDRVDRMLLHYRSLLEAAVADPDRPVADLPLLTEAERQRVLVEWNATDSPYPAEGTVAELFAAQVTRTPDAPALLYGGLSLTYRELNRRADRLAYHLRRLGVGPEVVVGVCLDRSPDLVVALLGVVKAGGAYLPLDPAYPRERLAFMLQDSEAPVLITRRSLRAGLETGGVTVVDLDEPEAAEGQEGNADHVESGATPESLFYVVYTSGSTGRPKGVLATQQAAINRFAWMWNAFPFREGEVCCQKTSISFVDAVWEIWGPLLRGVPLVLVPDAEARDPQSLIDALQRHRVSRLVLVPSLLQAMLDGCEEAGWTLPDLTLWVSSGEALSAELARRFRDRMPHARLLNLYGSSEVAADVTWFDAAQTPTDLAMVPIGRPIANARIYILDPERRPVPVGVPGELYVGGLGLARGYHRRPDLTAERWVTDPFSDQPEARLFRTGDLARYRPDGTIEYLGRRDHQVKIRGVRVELGEIEAVLAEQSAVREAVVTAVQREDGPVLVAYVVPAGDGETLARDWRAFLRSRLPESMVPANMIMLEALPLTPNGKVDRLALPEPGLGRPDSEPERVAPRTPVEQAVAEIWQEILKRPDLSIHDGFFELGGHSLHATRVIAHIHRRLGVKLPLQALFEWPTVAGLSTCIERERDGGDRNAVSPIPRLPKQEAYEQSHAQLRHWFQYRFAPENGVGHFTVHEVLGPLDVAAFQWAWQQIVRRHGAIRTTFEERNGVPVQIVHDEMEVPCGFRDLSTLSAPEQDRVLRAEAVREREEVMDLVRGPLYRLTLYRLDENRHLLFHSFHHIIFDGWTTNVMVRDLTEFYQAHREQREIQPLPEPLQYVDAAVWQNERLRRGEMEGQRQYWQQNLRGFSEPPRLPVDRVSAQDAQPAGVVQLEIDPERTARLRQFAQEQGVTLFTTMLAGLKIWMSLVSNQMDVTVGTPFSGRTHPDLEEVFGLLANPVVLRTDLSRNPTGLEVLRRVTATALGAQAHQDYPFDMVLAEARQWLPLETPLYTVVFVVQNAQHEVPLRNELSFRKFPEHELLRDRRVVDYDADPTMDFDMHIEVFEEQDRLTIHNIYHGRRFRRESIDRFMDQYLLILDRLVTGPERRLTEFLLDQLDAVEDLADLFEND